MPVGTYTVTLSYAGDTNYSAATTASASLTVTKANSTVLGSPASLVYGNGGSIPVAIAGQGNGATSPSGILSYTIGSGLPQTLAITNGTASISVPATLAAGTYAVAMSYIGDENYNAATIANVSLSIGQAALTVTPNSLSTSYNVAIPTLTGVLAGVINNDGITATYSTTAAQGSNAGTYPITSTLAVAVQP